MSAALLSVGRRLSAARLHATAGSPSLSRCRLFSSLMQMKQTSKPFALQRDFLDEYKERHVEWGFNGLGEFVYKRTYARVNDEGKQEEWRHTCQRVIEGVWRVHQRHVAGDVLNCNNYANATVNLNGSNGMNGINGNNEATPNHHTYDEHWAQSTAQAMYEKMFSFKWMPAGRGLWAMGTAITEGVRDPNDESKLLKPPVYAALNNCAFVSTASMVESNPGVIQSIADVDLDAIERSVAMLDSTMSYSPSEPFIFLMETAMLGIGCGFDTKGQNCMVHGSDKDLSPRTFVIPDSREGWCQALAAVMDSHFYGTRPIVLDFSLLRPNGAPIKTFGGIAGGPKPLMNLLRDTENVLESRRGKSIGLRAIIDVMNMIGVCVIAGNVRRTAEIAFGSWKDEEYLNLKNYELNPERAAFGWSSNNSVIIEDESDMDAIDYAPIAERIVDNGEPGIAWLCNMRNYGRMSEPKNFAELQAVGGNPCLEQTLWDHELCNLVETFPDNHKGVEDYKDTLRYALLYGKLVSLGDVHWNRTREVMRNNRRVGVSMSGLQQLVSRFENDVCKETPVLRLECNCELRQEMANERLKEWCEESYHWLRELDTEYSAMLGVEPSIKITSVKPSGSVSLLTGATPGLHWPIADFYIRRVRVAAMAHRPMIARLAAKGFPVEPANEDPIGTLVVSFPCKTETGRSGADGNNIEDIGEEMIAIEKANNVSVRRQLEFAATMQEYWADNQVSCTVSFDRKSEGHLIAPLLKEFQTRLKGISFLPRNDDEKATYEQMPYEEISEETYNEMVANIDSDAGLQNMDGLSDTIVEAPRFCSSESCKL